MVKLRNVIRSRLQLLVQLHPQLGLNGPTTYTSYIPDRFGFFLKTYSTVGHSHSEDALSKFLRGNEQNNRGDLARYYFLTLVCDQVIKENVVGDMAEVGVYKGNTAFLLAQTARKAGRTAYLFDTFEGFQKADLTGVDAGRPIEFSDTSLSAVRSFVGTKNVEFVSGRFPESIANVRDDLHFSIVHIDCDLYQPFYASLVYFYPRLARGGFLIMHDYSGLAWQGVEKAVDEFFVDKPEKIVPIPDKSGTAVIRKV